MKPTHIMNDPVFLREQIEQLHAELAERLEWNKACIESAAIASAEISKLQAERDEYHNQYHLCEAKLLAQKAINKQLGAEINRIKAAAKRNKP